MNAQNVPPWNPPHPQIEKIYLYAIWKILPKPPHPTPNLFLFL